MGLALEPYDSPESDEGLGGRATAHVAPTEWVTIRPGMDRTTVMKEYERQWGPWTSTLGDMSVSKSVEPGACGVWTIHDVVGHVNAYARYHLAQIRAAFSGVAPTIEEVIGDRGDMRQAGGSLDTRNEGLRTGGLALGWQQLLDEAEWLRRQTLAWVDTLAQEELDEQVGWVDFWTSDVSGPARNFPRHLRRLREEPAARGPMPVWQFVLPDKPPNHHLTEHLLQIRASLGP